MRERWEEEKEERRGGGGKEVWGGEEMGRRGGRTGKTYSMTHGTLSMDPEQFHFVILHTWNRW